MNKKERKIFPAFLCNINKNRWFTRTTIKG